MSNPRKEIRLHSRVHKPEFREYYETNFEKFWKILIKRFGVSEDTAKDIAQETMIALANTDRKSIRAKSDGNYIPDAYALSVLFKRSASVSRSGEKFRDLTELRKHAHRSHGITRKIEKTVQNRTAARFALEKIANPKTRQIVEMRSHDISYEDIARDLKTTVNNARKEYSVALRKLREIFEKD